MLSQTEENYLKALFHLTAGSAGKAETGTNNLAAALHVKPATVNNMLKKLKAKKLISYERYGKISLTAQGRSLSIEIVRKHRLWETFLSEKLGFSWDEVHEVAEQLEHIQSTKLIEKLEQYLDYPQFDPHGDAIPNARGEWKERKYKTLAQVEVGKSCRLTGVKDNSSSFLQYVDKTGLRLNGRIRIVSRQEYDGTTEIEAGGKKTVISQKFAENLFVV